MDLLQLKNEIEDELINRLVPFWLKRSIDKENGGFVGRITGTGDYDWKSNKAIVLNSRILWSFSALYNHYKKTEYYEVAERAHTYIKNNFLDHEFGGVYWLVDYKGRPVQTKKQVYAQAFMIYALSEFYKCNNDKEVLSDAIELFNLVEVHSFDKNKEGYVEAFTREWGTLDDVRLSEKDANANLTTNTHLHLLEAYTNLAKTWQSDKLLNQLQFLTKLFVRKITDPQTFNLRLFFDDSWCPISPEISYGHDIESSWLLCQAVDVLESDSLKDNVKLNAVKMSEWTLKKGFNSKGGLLYEDISGIIDDDAHWWSQAEGMVGFLNAYQITKDEKYLKAVYKLWAFTREYMIDRQLGEWYFKVNRNGDPCLEEDLLGPWKAPYHNMRACLEIIQRAGCVSLP